MFLENTPAGTGQNENETRQSHFHVNGKKQLNAALGCVAAATKGSEAQIESWSFYRENYKLF